MNETFKFIERSSSRLTYGQEFKIQQNYFSSKLQISQIYNIHSSLKKRIIRYFHWNLLLIFKQFWLFYVRIFSLLDRIILSVSDSLMKDRRDDGRNERRRRFVVFDESHDKFCFGKVFVSYFMTWQSGYVSSITQPQFIRINNWIPWHDEPCCREAKYFRASSMCGIQHFSE